MKILFDARHIKEEYSGLSRYTHSILKALIRINKNNCMIEIILDNNIEYKDNPLFDDLIQNSSKKLVFTYLDAPLFKMKHHFNVSKYVNRSDADIYFYPHFDIPVFINKNSIFVVHDLLPLVVDNYILKYKALKQVYFKNMIRFNLSKKNSKCIAVSKSTKNDILKYIDSKFADKIDVVYEDSFTNVIIGGENNPNVEKALDSKYILFIGDRRPHKNIKTMIDIMDVLQNKYNYDGKFIIAGSQRNFDMDIDKYIEDKGNIEAIGRVTDFELEKLYKNMQCLFFLTKYEGFGLPIIESAKFNKKIIVMDTSSCTEIAPENSLRVKLNQSLEEQSKEVFEYLDKDIEIDNAEYLKNFSWEDSVKSIFKGILDD